MALLNHSAILAATADMQMGQSYSDFDFAKKMDQWTMGQNQIVLRYLIIHIPMSSGLGELSGHVPSIYTFFAIPFFDPWPIISMLWPNKLSYSNGIGLNLKGFR